MEPLEAHADQGQGVVARVAEAQMEHGMRLVERRTSLGVPEKRQVQCLRLPHNWCRSAGLRRARPRNGRKHGYASPTYYFAFLGLLIASLSKRCEAWLFEYGSLSEHKENLMNN